MPKGAKVQRRPHDVHPADWMLNFIEVTESGCWLYTRSLSKHGYAAQVLVDGVRVTGHKAVYERMVGPVPNGLELDHLCRQRSCLNPAHLEPVTRRENVRRGTSGETTRTMWRTQETCQRGHSDWGWAWRTLPSGNRVQKRHCAECRRMRDRAA
jgi:HNH endonuclease